MVPYADGRRMNLIAASVGLSTELTLCSSGNRVGRSDVVRKRAIGMCAYAAIASLLTLLGEHLAVDDIKLSSGVTRGQHRGRCKGHPRECADLPVCSCAHLAW